jgi:hypothetical protein
MEWHISVGENWGRIQLLKKQSWQSMRRGNMPTFFSLGGGGVCVIFLFVFGREEQANGQPVQGGTNKLATT